MDKLNILVLHSLGNPKTAPNFLRHHVFFLQENLPEHNYIYHDTAFALPEYVSATAFDAIILDVTFLCARWAEPEQFESLKETYAFVQHSEAVKIAFPQDEYDCHILLDDWMCEWGVDVVYSVISSGWDLLYPRYHTIGEIRLGYTGYVSEAMLRMVPKAFDDRMIDIGYRARKLPPYFGRVGETKWKIGQAIESACASTELKTDIVLGDEGTLHGTAWLDFLNNCKFTLGANSGSSLLDPRGDIQRRVRAYLNEFPEATFEQVEEHCFKGLDGHHSFTALSPRVLEAGLLKSCQILVEGQYSGIVRAWEHFIPIKEDASDFDRVHQAMGDQSRIAQMIANCRAAILDVEDLRYKNKARKVIDVIGDLVSRKGVVSDCDAVEKTSKRYRNDVANKYVRLWRRQELSRRLSDMSAAHPSFSHVLRFARSMRSLLIRQGNGT